MRTHALTAKAIRSELKKLFPLIKFRVTSQTYSGGNSVAIEWLNGPTSSEVSKIVDKYQYGHFNGMEDIYENTNSRNDIPQVKYVQVRREVSEDVKQQVFKYLQKTHSYFDMVKSIDEVNDDLKKHWDIWCARDYVFRYLVDTDLTHGYNPDIEKEVCV